MTDYAVFMSLKDENGQRPWYEWEESLRMHDPEALKAYIETHKSSVRFWEFVQYTFFSQWNALREYAHQHRVALVGDLPIYVSLDSADVWSHPEQFQLDERHRTVAVAGCPPDYFSENGQLWGNPLYDWEAMKQDGYSWWCKRLSHATKLFDSVRIDHFRAFAGYWAVPAGKQTA